MIGIERLERYVKEYIIQHPKLEDEIIDLYTLCLAEIEEGGSVEHEIQLCETSIEQLIEEKDEDI